MKSVDSKKKKSSGGFSFGGLFSAKSALPERAV
jgi:hypothetical protein